MIPEFERLISLSEMTDNEKRTLSNLRKKIADSLYSYNRVFHDPEFRERKRKNSADWQDRQKNSPTKKAHQ